MTNGINRRTMLALTGSAAVAVALPSAPLGAVPAPSQSLPLPAWAVGTPGETDWMHIVARSADDARRAWVSEKVGGSGCEVAEEIADAGGLEAYLADGGEPPSDPCECEWCASLAYAEAERIKTWDGKPEGSASNADWLNAGMGSNCSRCGYECSSREGTGHAVVCDAVCGDCMTIADWRVVNPKHAAKFEADAATS